MDWLHIDALSFSGLNDEVRATWLREAELSGQDWRERAARRIRLILEGAARSLGLKGEVKMFGSFSNGFKTGTSDLDVVFVGTVGLEALREHLAKFALLVPAFGFDNITRILQASVPLVKFTDRRSQMEVDFCVNNELGIRNSALLSTYCRYDDRILRCGRMVKDWAKKHELVGTADGCLNSYAYMLLVIFFLQTLSPPVAPNLQQLSDVSVPIYDHKWGCEDCWETKFLEDISNLPPSQNTMDVGELLARFFHFYTCVFDWHRHAVCMRLNAPGIAVDKFSLATPTNEEQWYLEDPFDLKHNLAGKCTRAGKKRILEEMRSALQIISNAGKWATICPDEKEDHYFLKCRVSQGLTPQALLEEFEDFHLVKLHYPKQDTSARNAQAFLEFNTSHARRMAHTKNECYVADCHLQLHYSSQHGLAEAMGSTQFSTYEMASYKMQRQVLAARLLGVQGESKPAVISTTVRDLAGNLGYMAGASGHSGHKPSGQWDAQGGLPGMGMDAQQQQLQQMQQMQLLQQMQQMQMMQPMQMQQLQQMQQMQMLQRMPIPKGMQSQMQTTTPRTKKEASSIHPQRDQEDMLSGKIYPSQTGSTVSDQQANPQAKSNNQQTDPSAASKQIENKSLRAVPPSGVMSAETGFWLEVPIASQIPINSSLLDAAQQNTVRSLQMFLKSFPPRVPEHIEATSDGIEVRVVLQEEQLLMKSGLPMPLFSEDHFKKLRAFQEWSARNTFGANG